MSKIDLTAGTAVSLFLGGIASFLLVLVWGGFWAGLTLSTLWGWFIVPVFGLPTVTLLQAYGIAMVFRAARGIDTNKTNKDSFGTVMGRAVIGHPVVAGLTLGVGWVAKSWM